MKYKTIKIATISAITALSAVGIVNAASVSVTEPESFKICKSIENVYDATTATFNYTFTAGSTGLTGLPTSKSIAFSNATPTNNKVSKCIDVDLTGIAFSDNSPKQVTVEVAETAVSGYSVDSTKYTLLFDLRNTVDANNEITGQVATAYLHNASGQKVTQFDFSSTKQYGKKDIVLSKTVKGSGGDVNQYFKFTANISGPAGTTYTVSGASAGSNSATSCAANTDCVVYLKGGDEIRIGNNGSVNQIDVGETYTVTEDSYSGYTTMVANGNSAATAARTTGQRTVSATDADNSASFTNTKDNTIPTGLFLNLWPYILLGAISVGAVVYGKKMRTAKK